MEQISYKRVLSLAWPASLAALVTPLLGLIDSAALGYSARPLDVGAIGLAGSIYSLLYWALGFLRMSSAGMIAQAHGAGDHPRMRRVLGQSVLLGLATGSLLVLLQMPVGQGLFQLFTYHSDISAETEAAAKSYFFIRIWSAPFAIASFGLFGWLTARGRTGSLLAIVASMTALNAGLDVLFVVKFGWGAFGVAVGTIIAETIGFVAALLVIARGLQKEGGMARYWRLADFINLPAYRELLTINADIFIRSFLLASSFSYFVQRGSLFGDVVLSANQVLLQLVLITGLALDGAAIAAETLVGQSIGIKGNNRQRRAHYETAVRRTSVVAGGGAIAFTILFLVASSPIIKAIAPDPTIYAAAMTYLPWAIVSPLIVVTCFQLDGIFIGATRFRAMRNSMIISVALFITMTLTLIPLWSNHGLWLSFWIFMGARAVTLLIQLPAIGRSLAH